MAKLTKIMRCGPKFASLTTGLKREFQLSDAQLTDELAEFLERENFVPVIYNRARKNRMKPPRRLFS